MRSARPSLLLLFASAVALSASACAGPEPAAGLPGTAGPAPTPAESPAPLSDDARRQLIEGYWGAMAEVTATHDAGTEPMDAFLTGDAVEEFRQSLESLRRDGLRVVGKTSFLSATVLSQDAEGGEEILVCKDITERRVIDADDQDITRSDRGDVFAMRMIIETTPEGPRISDSSQWEGSSPC